jgi:hypothetical protein
MHCEHEPDPMMSAGEDGHCLIAQMPPITDEAAYEISELLRRLAEVFDNAYQAQLLRAYRRREEECERLYRERCLLEAQQGLPFEDDTLAHGPHPTSGDDLTGVEF